MIKSISSKKVLSVALLAVLTLVVFTGCTQVNKDMEVAGKLNEDIVDIEVIDEEMLVAHLSNLEVDDEVITEEFNERHMFSVGFVNTIYNGYSRPVFETGTSEGTLKLENVDKNKYTQVVEIYTEDDTLVYSAEIAVGDKIDKDKLLVELPAGEYKCEARYRNLDPDTGEKLGGATFDLIITVLN